jgi:hydroxymethylbilane synthase
VRLIIGTRGSQLALVQAHAIRDLLTRSHPDAEVTVQVIRTKGDVTGGSLASFGDQGVFTKEIETALLEKRTDLAVHSLKDLPTTQHPDLVLAATPAREDVRDVLVAPAAGSLAHLPQGATVGTGSLRRRAQLLALRPDLQLCDIRGNLDTRLALAENGDMNAVVLAAAGLHRLGWQERISAYLEPSQLLPAAGQAAIGLQMRRDHPLLDRVRGLNHAPTWQAITAERSLLVALRGGCHAPVGAWARCGAGGLILDGLVGRPDGSVLLRHRGTGSAGSAVALGREVADGLLRQGADRILSACAPSP